MFDPKSKNSFSVDGEALALSAIHPLLPLESRVEITRWAGVSTPCRLDGVQAFWTADGRLCTASVDSGKLVVTDMMTGKSCCLSYPEGSLIVGGHFAAQEFVLQNAESYFLARSTDVTPFWWRLQSELLPTVLERAGQTRVYARYYTPTRTRPAKPAEPSFALIAGTQCDSCWTFWSASGAGGYANADGWSPTAAAGHFLIGDIRLFGEVSITGILEYPVLHQPVSEFNDRRKYELTFDGLRNNSTDTFGQVDGKVICANRYGKSLYSLTAVDVNKG
jgi:hypothetical protein